MKQSKIIHPGDLHLLKKEIETLGESWDQDRLERRSEIDRLRMEVHAIRDALGALVPRFTDAYNESYNELLQTFDPEAERKTFRAG